MSAPVFMQAAKRGLNLTQLCHIPTHVGHRSYDGKTGTLHCDKCEGSK